MEAKAFVTSAVVLLLIVPDVLQATNDSACSDGSLMSLGVHRSALSVRHPILWSCFKSLLKPPSCFGMAWNVFDYHVLLGMCLTTVCLLYRQSALSTTHFI